ncbi:MAG: DeoR/GlpR family DNA-binding transcription regulator [Oscillospiraceae bacterium]|nr:DeoR/GlpR family DNA-binding transcription regulator [Oscillospiraceae bacterium]
MLNLERQQEILSILKTNKSATVNYLAKNLHINAATIRRDLTELEKKGLAKRTYGGALLIEGQNSEIPFYMRENKMKDAKAVIAKKAVELISNGDIIIMDSSSTTFAMVNFLKGHENLTIITNGAKTAIDLGELHIRVYCTGGILRENSSSFTGHHAHAFIDNISADLLFFSCRGVSMDGVLYDSSAEEAELRKAMIKNSKKSILLCDSSKLDKTAFYKICDISDIDEVICEAPLPQELLIKKEKT